jgi:hypothetical protein
VIRPLSYQPVRNFHFYRGLVYVAELGYLLSRLVQLAIKSENWQGRIDNAKGFRSAQSSSNYNEQRQHARIISNATIKGVKKMVSLTKTQDNFCKKECRGTLPSFLLNWIWFI